MFITCVHVNRDGGDLVFLHVIHSFILESICSHCSYFKSQRTTRLFPHKQQVANIHKEQTKWQVHCTRVTKLGSLTSEI